MTYLRIFIAALSIFVSGCAIQHPMKLNEPYLVEVPRYSPSQLLQGSALVVMTSEEQSRIHSSRAAYILGAGSEFSFEIGAITKAVAEMVFSKVFAEGVKVTTTSGPGSNVPVVRPSVKALEWWYRTAQLGNNFQEVVKLDLSVVIERNGQRVFDKTYSSGEVAGEFTKPPTPLGTAANKAVHQTIYRLMEQAASEFLAQR